MPKTIIICCFFLLPMFVIAQTADFNFKSSDGLFCNPVTIRFTQTCTGNPVGFVWDFGNNTKGYAGDVSVTYTKAGIYTVKLIAIYDLTIVEVSKTIVVNPAVTASIGYDKNYICTPGIINFTAVTSGNIVNYSWDFGDSSGTINALKKDTAHKYIAYGNYPVSLKVTDSTGCVGLANTSIKLIKPVIIATATPSSGCIPANVIFTANTTLPINDFVSKYSWDFGDGSPVSSTATNNTSHPYNTVGPYSPKLNIITNGGCTNSYDFPGVGFGTPPSNHNAYPKKIVACASETRLFVAKATNANSYLWDFGDGNSASVTDTITTHKYATIGIKTVTATPFFNGCAGTPKSFPITVAGVIANYTFSNTCTNKKTYSFINTSQGTLSNVLWNFGDASPTDSTTNTIHSFPASGQFITSLIVTDTISSCADTSLQTIYTAVPALVNPDSSICKNANTNFSITNTYSGPATYTWNIAGSIAGTTTTPAITVKAGTLGIFNNYVSINYGAQSCLDTLVLNHPISVKGPDLNFNAPATICFNTLLNISNNSKPFIATDPIRRWYWNYGYSIANDTIYQPAPVKYPYPGSFNIKLIAIDINGCMDSLVKSTTVNPTPFLRVIPHKDTLCLGQSATVKAFSSDPVLWSPANNISCLICDSVGVNPVVTTKYHITATTPLNCSITDSVLVNVYPPFTAIAPSTIFYICRNDQVQLDIGPKGKKVSWTPATGLSNATIYSPIASPQQSTTYTANLTDSVGCFSSKASIDVVVKSLPTVDAGPDKIVPYYSIFTIAPAYSNNIIDYTWSPNSLLSCTDCATTSGTAQYSDTFTIKVTSDSGCVAIDSITVYVECKYAYVLLPKAFTPNNDNLNDYFYPVTRGIKSILKFTIFNRGGQVMYEAKNFFPNSKTFAWNGDYKGLPQPAAAYVYVLEALCDVGEKVAKSGSFLLLR